MEPFWDLKIGMHVEYLTHTSSKYVTSWVLPSLTSTAGRTSHVLLADIIPWINKTSLVLQVCTVRTLCAMLQPIWCSEAVWCCQVRLLWLKLVIVEVESWVSDSNSAIEAPASMWLGLCTHYMYIDDLLPYKSLELCSYWGHGQVFHIKIEEEAGMVVLKSTQTRFVGITYHIHYIPTLVGVNIYRYIDEISKRRDEQWMWYM